MIDKARLTKLSFVLLLLLASLSSHGLESFDSVRFELAGKTYHLEIADTDARRMQGLMFRQQLDSDRGMLFVYQQSEPHYIWMKNTRIPLTVLWLDQNARIIDKQLLKPCQYDPCPTYGSGAPSQFIIELAATEFNRLHRGDRLKSIEQWYQQQHGSKSCFLGLFC